MTFQQISDCLEPVSIPKSAPFPSVSGTRGLFLASSSALGVLLLLAGGVSAAVTPVVVDMKLFSPDSVLNGYWMYMDSTITTSNGTFATADEGNVGAGSWLNVANGGHFKTPTMIRGDVTATEAQSKQFDSSLWVVGNASFAATKFTSASSKLRFDGTFSFSNNGGSDSSETWVAGAATFLGNSSFTNRVHLKSTMTVTGTPLGFSDSVFYDLANIADLTMAAYAAKRRATTVFTPPFGTPKFFDSTGLPGQKVVFAPPAGRANVNGTYKTSVCGPVVTCPAYPGISNTDSSKKILPGSVLPPGYYGSLNLNNDTVVLGEGVYYFDDVQISNNRSRLVAYQPTGERTIIYANGGFTCSAGGMFVGSDSGFIASKFGVTSSPDDFSGGTVMIVTGPHANIKFDSDAQIWATLSAPTGSILVNSQLTLFGQMFARHFNAANNFNGGAGKFVPFFPEKPVVSFDVTLFSANVKEGNLLGNGNPDTTIARFQVQMDHISGSAVAIWYHTAPVTASTGGTTALGTNDYVHVAKGSVTIPPLYDTASILIKVLGDLSSEANETFRVVIDSVVNGTLGKDSVGIGTIRDDDSTRYVRLVAVKPTKLERPTTSAAADTAFHYNLEVFDKTTGKTIPTKFDLSAKLKLVNVPGYSVVFGVDVNLPASTVTIKAGDSVVPVRVVLSRRNIFKPGVFQLVLDSSFGAMKGDSIVNDTITCPPVKLVVGDGTADQSVDTVVNLPVQLVRVSDGVAVLNGVPLSFTWSTINGSATGGVHFVAVAGQLDTFMNSRTLDTLRVKLIRNQLYDSTRHFKVELVPNPYTNLSTARDSGTGTIVNGWARPEISINDTTFQRRTTDFVVKIPVRLNRIATFKSAYSFAAVNGGAVNGVDFTLAAGSSSIAGTDTITITIKASNALDSTRRFVLTIPTWDATRLSKGDTAAIVTLTSAITNARLLVDPASADQSKDSTVRFPVRLVDGSGNAITTRIPVPFTYSTLDGSAKAGTHFVGENGATGTVRVGNGSDTFAIKLIRTALYDSTRHFQVDVAALPGIAGLSTAHDTATGTISNGYTRPVIHIDSASIARPVVKTALMFRVWLDRASAIDLPFAWSTRDGGAITGTDYVGVDTTSGTIRDSAFLPVSVLARPGEYDTTRHFHVDLSKLSAFANASASALGAITPSLGAPYLWVRPSSVEEGPAGKDTLMVFRVELRDSVGGAMTSRLATPFTWSTVPDYKGNGVDSVAWSVPHGALPADYAAMVAGKASVPVLATEGTFAVVVHGNDIKQGDRVLQVRIDDATWARLDTAGSKNMGTILDDDSISTRAFFPVARDTVGESISIAWIPVALTKKALFADTLVVTVNSRSTAVRDTNYVLLQPSQTDIRDTAVVPSAKTNSVRLVVQPGDSLLWFPVRIRHDSVRTSDLRLIMDLAVVNPWDVKVDPGRSQTEIIVANVDPPPYLGFSDTLVTMNRGQTTKVRVAVKPLRSDKDPSAQYTGTITGSEGALAPTWSAAVSTAREASTPTFTRMDFDTSFPFATINDGRDGPDLRVVLRMHDWTPGEALQPPPGYAFLHDSVVILIRNTNASSKVSFWTNSVTVQDVEGEVAVKVLLDKGSNWNTGASVTRTGDAKDVLLSADSSVKLIWKPGDTVATFVLKFGNDHKVGPDREVKLHLGDFLHLVPGADSVLTIRIVNTNKNPVVKITSPSEGATLGKKDLDSLGKVPVKWTVDGTAKAPYDTLIPEGPSTITKCYADEWGNVGCDSVHVTLDTTPPVVVITEVSKDGGQTWLKVTPSEIPWVNKPDVLVKWISIDRGDTTRHQDGETLKDSINKVLRCTEDAVGNKGCGTGLVGLDTIPPKVWIETPPDGSHWAAGCIPMIWFEEDDSTLRHDSLVCFATTGPHTITVKSKPDHAGNVGTTSVTIVVDPNEPGKAVYLDTDNDGRIDAVTVQFPRKWIDSLPWFDISYGGVGANTIDSTRATYGDKSQAGTPMVYDGEEIRVLTGVVARDSSGAPLRDSKGKIVYQAPGGTPLLDDKGKQVVDANGVPLWKVTGTGKDSTVLVIRFSPELPYGWTSSTIDSLGVIHATVTVLDSTGKAVTKDMKGIFDILDGVPPVIVSATTTRTEEYEGRDVLTIKVSEPLVFDASGDWLEINVGGNWVKVPAESLTISDDGKTIRIPLPPGEEGVPDPGVKIRFLDGVSDSAGNKVVTDGLDWSVEVTGDPRPPRLDVDVVDPIGHVSHEEQMRTRKSGFVITATNGGNRTDFDPWRPGQGYLGSNGDDQFREICPDVRECNGLEIEVNHPMRVQVYVYDLLGVHAGGFTFELTQQDLDDMNPDKLDRYRIRVLWNQRGQDGRVVSTGIYPWRVVSWVQLNSRTPPVLTNTVVKLGVKTRLQ